MVELLVASEPGDAVQTHALGLVVHEVGVGDVDEGLVGGHDDQGAHPHVVGVVVDGPLADPVVLGGRVHDAIVIIGEHVARNAAQALGGVAAGQAFDGAGLAEWHVGVGEHAGRAGA